MTDVGGFAIRRVGAAAVLVGVLAAGGAAAAPAPPADDLRRARPVPPPTAPAVPLDEAIPRPGAEPRPAAPDAGTRGADAPARPPPRPWAFELDAEAARARAWLEPWPRRDAGVGLRCGLAAPASTAESAGFVDLVVDDGVFFRGRPPPALRDSAFRISQLRLSFDGPRPRTRTLNARYDRASGHYVTGIALDDPLLEGLMAGYTLWLDEPLASGRVELTLAGSRDAITQLIDVCP